MNFVDLVAGSHKPIQKKQMSLLERILRFEF